MTGGTITANGSTFILEDGGQIDTINTSVTTENSGIKFKASQNDKTSEINLTDTKLFVKNGIGINTNQSIGKVNLRNSKILADTLFKNAMQKTESDGTFILTADHSILQGGVRNDENGRTNFDLKNNTIWTLKISKQEKDDDGNLLDIAQRARSEVSVLNLNNSFITFDSPTEDHYQTLHIGSGKPETKAVYNVTGNAQIAFNTEWSDGKPIADQKTDRLLIHGNVLGTTTIYFQNRLEKERIQADDSDPLNTRGISLIQVSGKANENSFKLENGYIAIKGLPYKYVLTAYGSEANYGQANANQNLLGSGNNFWDFRLQNAFLDPNLRVKAVLPQVPSYFVMPNALFYTGLTDMAKQNALLANRRISVVEKEQEKRTASSYTPMAIQKNSPLKVLLINMVIVALIFAMRCPRRY